MPSYSRRSILTGSLALSTVALSGCAGLLGEDDGGDSSDSQDSGDGATPEPTPSEDELQSDIVSNYQQGLASLEGGNAGLQLGSSDYSLEDYESSRDSFAEAEDSFADARTAFSDAVDLTYEIGNSEARDVCDTAQSHAASKESIAENMRLAAEARIDGDVELADTHIEQAIEFENDAEQNPPPDISTLESTF